MAKIIHPQVSTARLNAHQKKLKGRKMRHALQRLYERYGLNDWDIVDIEAMSLMIEQGGGHVRYLLQESHQASVWRVEYRDNVIIALYDKKYRVISTVFPAYNYLEL